MKTLKEWREYALEQKKQAKELERQHPDGVFLTPSQERLIAWAERHGLDDVESEEAAEEFAALP